jgi:hypothetical protein
MCPKTRISLIRSVSLVMMPHHHTMSSHTTNATNLETAPFPQKKVQYQKMCRPKTWRAEIANIKQPCWCGEEWKDYHEDGNHGPVWVEVEGRDRI